MKKMQQFTKITPMTTMMMTNNTIFVKRADMPDFKEMISHYGVRHGPFHKTSDGYTIEILDPKNAVSYFILKYSDQV